jgi:hypothetical protein
MTFTRVLEWLPPGYRVIDDDAVECARGCGWKLGVDIIARLPADARTQLFRNHDGWHRRNG